MENNNLPAEMPKDFSTEDRQLLKAFVDSGAQGVSSITDVQMRNMLELYLSGKTYLRIANTMRIKPEVVLYFSNRFRWDVAKESYHQDMQRDLRERLLETKIVSQNFLNDLIFFWHKKIGNKMNEFLRTGNEDAANSIDLKDIDKYLKTIEVLQRLTSESTRNNKPAVGLNLGDGVKVKKVSDTEVEITPKEKTIGEMLKEFADFRRSENKTIIEDSSDISISKGDETHEN